MDGFITHLARGDHLIWQQNETTSVYIIVTHVARDESWVDLHMFTFAVSWTKRMPMPMPRRNIRYEGWDSVDLKRDADSACKGAAARHGFTVSTTPE
jgi:hypothetical protein